MILPLKKYPNVFVNLLDNDDDILKDETTKLSLINKSFPFTSVSGMINVENSTVELSFINSETKKNFTIIGNWNEKTDSLDSIFSTELSDTKCMFNYHPFGSLGGFNDAKFLYDIMQIHTRLETYSIVVAHESYGIYTLDKLLSKEEAENKIEEFKIQIVQGVHLDGKLIDKDNKLYTID